MILSNSWFICESILRLAISIVIYLAYFLWDNDLTIDTDNLQNVALFIFETFILYYTTARTYYSFKRAKYGMFRHVKPVWLHIEIVFNMLCVIGAVIMANFCRNSEIQVFQRSSIWFALLDVHFILNLLITAVSQREIQNFIVCIQLLNEKSSNELTPEDAILCYQNLYNGRLFGKNLNMWRNEALKTVFEYEYYRLQSYLHSLNQISLADRALSSKLVDKLRDELNDHANKLIKCDNSLQKWKELAEKPNVVQLDDLQDFRRTNTKIRDFCF